MKKLVFLFAILLAFPIQAKELSLNEEIQLEAEKYQNKCFHEEAFPNGIENYNIYTDDIKEGDYRYHQCLKKVIVQKIQEIASAKDAQVMIHDLDQIQAGVSDFYWVLFNREDNGTLGRGMNDAVLGRYFERFLAFIISYQFRAPSLSSFTFRTYSTKEMKEESTQKIIKETQQYIESCYKNDFSSVNINKKNEQYHQCLKNLIVQKIEEISSGEYTQIMIKDLNQIQKAFLDFYNFFIFNKQQNILEKGANDVLLGRFLESILEDIIYYQHQYRY